MSKILRISTSTDGASCITKANTPRGYVRVAKRLYNNCINKGLLVLVTVIENRKVIYERYHHFHVV